MHLYKSKIDFGIIFLVWFVVIILCCSIIYINNIFLIILVIAVIVFVFSILYMTYYKFKEEYLYLRQGLFVEKIKYEKITEAKYCKNYFSSMALARDRIMIKHGKNIISGITYISPENKEEFMKELYTKCINLKK